MDNRPWGDTTGLKHTHVTSFDQQMEMFVGCLWGIVVLMVVALVIAFGWMCWDSVTSPKEEVVPLSKVIGMPDDSAARRAWLDSASREWERQRVRDSVAAENGPVAIP